MQGETFCNAISPWGQLPKPRNRWATNVISSDYISMTAGINNFLHIGPKPRNIYIYNTTYLYFVHEVVNNQPLKNTWYTKKSVGETQVFDKLYTPHSLSWWCFDHVMESTPTGQKETRKWPMFHQVKTMNMGASPIFGWSKKIEVPMIDILRCICTYAFVRAEIREQCWINHWPHEEPMQMYSG